MSNEFEPTVSIDSPRYNFDFGLMLGVAIPRYSEASSAAIRTNIEVYCAGIQRDVSLALIDGMSVHSIAELFGLKPRQAIIVLEGAIQTIKDMVNLLSTSDVLVAADPYDIITTSDAVPDETTNWRAKAECLNSDPEIFFNPYSVALAKEVCARCQVTENCTDLVLQTGDKDGVWGGLDQDELSKLRSKRSTTS